MDLTQEEIEARIEQLDNEIDVLTDLHTIDYKVAEGFWQVETDYAGERHIFPIAEAWEWSLEDLRR